MNIIYEPSVTSHWRTLFENKSMLLGSHNLNIDEELIAEISGINPNGEINDKKGKKEIVAILLFKNAPSMVLNQPMMDISPFSDRTNKNSP